MGVKHQNANLSLSFTKAFAHHQAGRFCEAEALYNDVLANQGCHADSLHLLGVLAFQTQRHELAITLIGRAIAVNGRVAAFHFNLGNTLGDLGRLDEAARCYRKAIGLEPGAAHAHSNLGNTLRTLGQLDEAAKCYRKAVKLNPTAAYVHNNLGNALQEQGHLNEALDCYRRTIQYENSFHEAYNNIGNTLVKLGRLNEAIDYIRKCLELQPSYAEGHSNLGFALQQQGHLDEAVASFRRAISLRPDFAPAFLNLGSTLEKQGRLEEAVICYRKATELTPNDPNAYNNLGIIWKKQGHLDQAAACFRIAIDLNPAFSQAHSNLGAALFEQELLNEAVLSCHRAIKLKSDYPEAHSNLGAALQKQGRLNEAIDCYRSAITIEPGYADAHFNLSIVLLRRGDMAEGWKEYEWRWKTHQFINDVRHFVQPQWRGEPSVGQTLLMHAEQGFGDTLQFCRYAELAAARGMRVIVEVPKPLVRLLRSLSSVDHVVAQGDDLPHFDLHSPMLSMPLALETNLATIPCGEAYLHADERQVIDWQKRLAAMPCQGFRVGLVWAGNPLIHSPALAAVDRRRSIAPERLAPLFDQDGLHFFSLQKGGPAMPADFQLTDVMDEMDDFADTAALIANLDLVIAVDTAVAHLAAALGKPVWLLNRFDSCWRWFHERNDSPWYPMLRLYNQPQPGDWDTVLANVARDLRSVVVRGRAM